MGLIKQTVKGFLWNAKYTKLMAELQAVHHVFAKTANHFSSELSGRFSWHACALPNLHIMNKHNLFTNSYRSCIGRKELNQRMSYGWYGACAGATVPQQSRPPRWPLTQGIRSQGDRGGRQVAGREKWNRGRRCDHHDRRCWGVLCERCFWNSFIGCARLAWDMYSVDIWSMIDCGNHGDMWECCTCGSWMAELHPWWWCLGLTSSWWWRLWWWRLGGWSERDCKNDSSRWKGEEEDDWYQGIQTHLLSYCVVSCLRVAVG